MRDGQTLPLGVDLGVVRTRVALCRRDRSGTVTLAGVATRPTLDDPAAALVEACEELGTRERRCVLALGVPDALVRRARFPALRRWERERAARFEAARFVDYPTVEAAVRVTPLPDGEAVLGIARRTAVEASLRVARAARLHPVAIDDRAFALLRALPESDAILDVGEHRSTLIAQAEPIPVIVAFELGGASFTAAIVAALGIDVAAAEHRKHAVGLAGAGEYARDALVEAVTGALVDVRATLREDVRRLTLVGNGSRLPGLAAALQRAAALPVESAAFAPHVCEAMPPDVLRAAAPDWAVAYGLALWAVR